MNVSMTQLLQEMNLSSIEQAHDYCMSFGIDPKKIVLETPVSYTHLTLPTMRLV